MGSYNKKASLFLLLVITVGALVIAGCGGGGSEGQLSGSGGGAPLGEIPVTLTGIVSGGNVGAGAAPDRLAAPLAGYVVRAKNATTGETLAGAEALTDSAGNFVLSFRIAMNQDTAIVLVTQDLHDATGATVMRSFLPLVASDVLTLINQYQGHPVLTIGDLSPISEQLVQAMEQGLSLTISSLGKGPVGKTPAQINAEAAKGNRFVLIGVNLTIAGRVTGDVGMLDPTQIPKYQDSLIPLNTMPKTSVIEEPAGKIIDYYEIAMRQFQEQVLPTGFPKTTLWGYGSVQYPDTFHSPAFSIEAEVDRPVRVKWINDLKDPVTGNFLPHLLPIDQTMHWANPPKDCLDGIPRTDCQGVNPYPYTGPVPMVTHLHGAHVSSESDGYSEAWYLPAANNITPGYATRGFEFDQISGVPLEDGAAVYQYPNDQRASTLWFHDHALGMTRNNVYAGPVGFYLLRGGPSDLPSGVLPSDKYEVPLIIQDKSFYADGSLFYPKGREFFDGFTGPYFGDTSIPSDVSPIWNAEFFGNTMVVNGKTWPVLDVEARRYRFRLLNASDSRFFILNLAQGSPSAATFLPIWQIGADSGFLAQPVQLSQLLLAPAERADIIVDFSDLPVGTEIFLINIGPDEPFGGGTPGVDFAPANPATTGQVMKLKIVGPISTDTSTSASALVLPSFERLAEAVRTRMLSLNEDESSLVCVNVDNQYVPCSSPDSIGFLAPISARLGTFATDIGPVPYEWMDPITENPGLNDTEIWEIHNFTEDAHPIHIHLVAFEVVNREDSSGVIYPPEPGETGTKDTVIVYPGGITRVKAKFDLPGLYMWHCHILSHEDNEMMRPFFVGNQP